MIGIATFKLRGFAGPGLLLALVGAAVRFGGFTTFPNAVAWGGFVVARGFIVLTGIGGTSASQFTGALPFPDDREAVLRGFVDPNLWLTLVEAVRFGRFTTFLGAKTWDGSVIAKGFTVLTGLGGTSASQFRGALPLPDDRETLLRGFADPDALLVFG